MDIVPAGAFKVVQLIKCQGNIVGDGHHAMVAHHHDPVVLDSLGQPFCLITQAHAVKPFINEHCPEIAHGILVDWR